MLEHLLALGLFVTSHSVYPLLPHSVYPSLALGLFVTSRSVYPLPPARYTRLSCSVSSSHPTRYTLCHPTRYPRPSPSVSSPHPTRYTRLSPSVSSPHPTRYTRYPLLSISVPRPRSLRHLPLGIPVASSLSTPVPHPRSLRHIPLGMPITPLYVPIMLVRVHAEAVSPAR